MAPLYLSFALASLGFSALRLSTVSGRRDMAFIAAALPPWISRCIAAILLAGSLVAIVAAPIGDIIEILCWFFCVMPLAALPAIFIWPYRPRLALLAIPSVAVLMAVFAGIDTQGTSVAGTRATANPQTVFMRNGRIRAPASATVR